MKRDVCTCYENYFKIVPPMTFWSDTNSDLPIAKTNSVMFTINYPITKWVLRNFRLFGPADRKYFFKIEQVVTEFLSICLQTHHVGSTLKRRGNDRFYIVSTWNPRGVLVGLHLFMLNIIVWTTGFNVRVHSFTTSTKIHEGSSQDLGHFANDCEWFFGRGRFSCYSGCPPVQQANLFLFINSKFFLLFLAFNSRTTSLKLIV